MENEFGRAKVLYQHFCPAARALDIVGEKWSLLIVRDLLGQRRRFSDLRRLLKPITPRRLSLRLLELGDMGIVERATQGREVWYCLTPRGKALQPVIEELLIWGIENAMRPPRPEEPLDPGRTADGMVTYLNRRKKKLSRPASLNLEFDGHQNRRLTFDGDQWTIDSSSDQSKLAIKMSNEQWAVFLSSGEQDRHRLLQLASTEGSKERLEEFAALMGKPTLPT